MYDIFEGTKEGKREKKTKGVHRMGKTNPPPNYLAILTNKFETKYTPV